MKIKLAFREIAQNRKFSVAYILNLSLGLFGFLLLNSLNESVQKNFQTHSRSILTADLAIACRRPLDLQEEEKIAPILKKAIASTQTIELYSMVVTPRGSRLAELIAIEDQYPLYGEIQLKKGGTLHLNQQPLVWISTELAAQMNLRIGDTLQLGALPLRVEDQIGQDSRASWNGFSLAPKLYLGVSQLHQTGLLRPGSTVWYRKFFKFSSEEDVEKATKFLKQKLTDPGIQIISHRTAGEQMGRIFAYLSDYLGLVALVGLFLASLGSSYLFQSFLSHRLKEIATLISLGLPPLKAAQIYLAQVTILGLASVLVAFFATAIALPIIGKILSFQLELPLLSLLSTFLVGVGASLLISLPFLFRIRSLSPTILFQDTETQIMGERLESILSCFPALFCFYLLAVWQAHSWKIGSLFFFGLCFSSLFLAALVPVGLRILRRLPLSKTLSLKLASRYLVQNPRSTLALFLSVGIGAVLTILIPQMHQNIKSEILAPSGAQTPSLFLFDIQEDQVNPLSEFLKSEGASLLQISPLVRARLEAMNGNPFQKKSKEDALSTREDEQENRMRNRGFNLSSRDPLSESEVITSGKPFSGKYLKSTSKIPEISVERTYAKTLGMHLGDVLQFDVQGTPILGKIVNFRKVRWTSFQPNFFIQFQSGVLDDAPKTYLATIGKLNIPDRARIQNKMIQQFSNISVVDVSSLIQRMLELFEQLSGALQLMALLSVITGNMVLFSISRHQAQTRQREVQLLKVLGAKIRLIEQTHWIEFGGIGLLASLFGAAVSIAFSWLISAFLFDSSWSFSWLLPVKIIFGMTLITSITTSWAMRKTLNEKPLSLLNQGE